MDDIIPCDRHKPYDQISQISESEEYEHNIIEDLESETAKKSPPTNTHGNYIIPVSCLNRCGEVLESTTHEGHIANDCPLTMIDCEFKHVGCDVRLPRRDMPLHLGQAVIYHLSKQTAVYERRLKMLETDNERLTAKCVGMEEKLKDLEQKLKGLMFTEFMTRKIIPNDPNLLIDKLKENRNTSEVEPLSEDVVNNSYVFAVKPQQKSPTYTSVSRNSLIPVTLTMTNFEQHQLNDDHWVSKPFFTHPQGYTMCLRVTANGQGSGKSTHITVGVYLMKGEFDYQLDWPFRGDITIQLLNQDRESTHHTKTVYGAKSSRDKATGGGKIFKAWEIGQYMSHTDLYSKYLRNDSLKFRIFTVIKQSEISLSHELATDV